MPPRVVPASLPDGGALAHDLTVDDSKSGRRAEALRRRRALSPERQTAAALTLAEAVTAALRPGDGPVAAYASFGTEPATGPLRTALRGRVDVLLPVLRPDGDLDWAIDDGRLVTGPAGLPEPAGPRLGTQAVARCTLLVVPALEVDRSGTRLGRGGGSYDRALARARGWVVAALHAGELVPALPREPHDRPVHAVVVPEHGLLELLPDPRAHRDGRPAGMSG